ncbi:MAG TPA: molybdopterin-dependent oxidoreductase [Rectinemataceae bacterium]|nr:molybdopterin-dependent oxidoreductase [Rectinemataceae bacterium]
MSKKMRNALAVVMAAVFVLAGCVSQKSAPLPAGAAPATTVAAPAPVTPAATAPAAPAPVPATADSTSAASDAEAGWSIELAGARKDSLSQSYYKKIKAAGVDYIQKTVDKKGVATIYSGIPLRLAIAMIDGSDSAHPYAFDAELWAKGYEVTLTAADGYSATFSTKDLAQDALIIADTEAGKPLDRPMIVGDSAKGLWVKQIASIGTSLAPSKAVSEAASFALELDINGAKASYTLADLEKDPAFMENKGSFTTSAGTKYSNVYGGVGLRAILGRFMSLSADDSITFAATDGYEMTYSGKQLLDEADGTWILAFRMDGDWLPKDPGYIRTVKIGPNDPNIDGHTSVKMIKRIVVKQKDFKDFTISYSGKMSGTMDRATVQSCVSCHKKEVNFERKGISGKYTGFPLQLLLGYADDPKYQPHKQDTSILAYDAAAAKAGYKVEVVAADGYKITLDSRDLDANNEVIIAMYKEGAGLDPSEFPLVLVWDKNTARLPEGIKNVKQIASINLVF